MPDTRQRVRGLVEKVAGKAVPEDPEESLFDRGVLDSFKLPDLVSALEQEFSIHVSDADLRPRNFESLARIEEYIDTRS
jgi:acyl carrier protein